MKILSLDTSAKTATAALVSDSELVAEYSILTTTHSTTLLPMIESIFKLAGIKAEDVDLYAVTVGPGSFTGIRIGVSTVKGLAFAYNTPCVGVSALSAMAENLGGLDGIIVPVIDARRDMVYTALFRSLPDGSVERLTEDMQISIDELFELLGEYRDTRIYFTGDAYTKVSERFSNHEQGITPVKLRAQSAYGVASAGLKLWNNTEDKSALTAAALMPVYLRKSQAEREREERLAAENNIQ
ncbi:MAG: tRNA (adenosine(37)-N6)-threonylcarbamoyltransferase complex dimerization subunit type 1 TsaB [Ruminococcaceae bacterium]|nr:tRNA (adenosine(37)-N6)-threonylcarbamoyltransferase complex dimerization subunit type 1 TsaB [Oscillospiraceae bacterium]